MESLSALSDPFELIRNVSTVSNQFDTVRNSGALKNNQIDFALILNRAKTVQSPDNQENQPVEQHAAAQENSLNGKFKIDKTDKLYEMCLELETFLVKNLITSMRNTVQKSGLIDQGFAGKMYEDMLYDEYAKNFARNANFGLAEQAYRQLKMYSVSA
ncbi:MAG: rod-binding protein [Treponema sp.]|jgi:flagellar protein FlgJ|nr:rod-binding protein [Treponema sp.]